MRRWKVIENVSVSTVMHTDEWRVVDTESKAMLLIRFGRLAARIIIRHQRTRYSGAIRYWCPVIYDPVAMPGFLEPGGTEEGQEI